MDASGPPLRPQANIVSSPGTEGFHTHASTLLSVLPVNGEASGPIYQSLLPSRVTALTPSTVSILGISNSASKSPSRLPVFNIVSAGPDSSSVRSMSIKISEKTNPLRGNDRVIKIPVSILNGVFITNILSVINL